MTDLYPVYQGTIIEYQHTVKVCGFSGTGELKLRLCYELFLVSLPDCDGCPLVNHGMYIFLLYTKFYQLKMFSFICSVSKTELTKK